MYRSNKMDCSLHIIYLHSPPATEVFCVNCLYSLPHTDASLWDLAIPTANSVRIYTIGCKKYEYIYSGILRVEVKSKYFEGPSEIKNIYSSSGFEGSGKFRLQ